ncbi:MAG: SDR family NAD(P)-dependent oxidoreductase [Muribaculaceae bacterium]|nr:SDR family NAD(P)-dependent oxidoreductase [Muribaculaceae bacterium]
MVKNKYLADFSGRRVVVMGASSGIGLQVARALAAAGVRVGLAARRTQQLEALKQEYPSLVECAAIDVNDSDAPARLMALIGELGGMDIYFHAAGIGVPNPGMDPDEEARVISTNAAGFARMLAAAYNYFRTSGHTGRIAAITSVAGTKGIGTMAAYSASKRCASTYMEALGQLAREEKVPVKFTDIRPGWIDTPLLTPGTRHAMEMTPQYAVPLIIRAIARGGRVAVVDWRWRMLVALWRLLPSWLWVRLKVNITI